jgi:hypothetical protein
MIEWSDGTFAFHPTEPEPVKGGEWGVDSDSLLLDIFSGQDQGKQDGGSD